MFSQHQLTSAAIPAVGTGVLGYPYKDVADTLVSATVEFLNDNPSSTLKEVSFVSYSDDLIQQVSQIYSIKALSKL